MIISIRRTSTASSRRLACQGYAAISGIEWAPIVSQFFTRNQPVACGRSVNAGCLPRTNGGPWHCTCAVWSKARTPLEAIAFLPSDLHLSVIGKFGKLLIQRTGRHECAQIVSMPQACQVSKLVGPQAMVGKRF